RDFAADDEPLDEDLVVEAQGALDGVAELIEIVADADADRRALADGLDDRREAEIAMDGSEVGGVVRGQRVVSGSGQVVQAEQLLCLALVHRESGGEDIRAGVGNAEHLEEALDAAVLAPAAVESDERDFDVFLAKRDVDVAIDIDGDSVVTAL